MSKKILALLLGLSLLLGWPAAPVFAQEPGTLPVTINWQELETEHFLIVYAQSINAPAPVECVCGVAEAQRYAAFADQVYTDLTAIFGAPLDTPINLRLFPTEESYFEVNPIARQLTGVIAHALNNRQEIAIALPRTTALTQEQVVNNVRHELTHFFASQLSNGKLTAGFQEGLAQYLEKPTDQAGSAPALLRQALDQNRLLTWAELDQSRAVYSDPQVAYPQSLAVAAFLIDRYGLPQILEFLEVSAREPGYRSALQAAYDRSADQLEADWLAYLPDYIDTRWQINALYAYDLSRVSQLVDSGAYSAAEAELADIIALLETTNQSDSLAQAQALLARAQWGQAVADLVDQARRALTVGDYAGAVAVGNQAIDAYEALGYRARIPEAQLYVHRAQLGQQALAQLASGEQLLNALRFFEAEAEINQATIMLQSLNNQSAAAQGLALLTLSARRQSLLAYALLAVGLAMVLANGLRRLANRYNGHPLEVEFT